MEDEGLDRTGSSRRPPGRKEMAPPGRGPRSGPRTGRGARESPCAVGGAELAARGDSERWGSHTQKNWGQSLMQANIRPCDCKAGRGKFENNTTHRTSNQDRCK